MTTRSSSSSSSASAGGMGRPLRTVGFGVPGTGKRGLINLTIQHLRETHGYFDERGTWHNPAGQTQRDLFAAGHGPGSPERDAFMDGWRDYPRALNEAITRVFGANAALTMRKASDYVRGFGERTTVITPDSPYAPGSGKWQATLFTDGEPTGHELAASREEALREALKYGYTDLIGVE